MNMKIAIYARVSTERQEKEETIKSQLEVLRDYAKQNSYSVIDEYIDDGWSGEMMARPELDRLRDDANKGMFEGVLIHSPDRLARKYAYQYLIQEELEKKKIKLLFVNHEISDNPEDQLMLGFQGLIAEYEKAKILERTRRGRLAKARRGQIIGSIPPYGYDYVKKTEKREGYYKVNESEASVVKTIFSMFVKDKKSLRGIVRELTLKGQKPRGGGAKWGRSSVARIISNTSYTGTTYYNKYYSCETENSQQKYRRLKRTGRRLRDKSDWIAISIPRIIEKTLFDQAQNQLVENMRLSPRNVKYQYLLKGMVICGECGLHFYGSPNHGKTYYRCSNRNKRFPFKKDCKASIVKTTTLDLLVWQSIAKAIQKPEIITEQVKRYQERHHTQQQEIQKELERTTSKLSKLDAKESRLLDAYSGKVISLDQLKEKVRVIKVEREALEQQRQKTESEGRSYPHNVVKGVRYYCKAISRRLNTLSFDERQTILRLLLNEVEINDQTVLIKGVIPVNTEHPVKERIAMAHSNTVSTTSCSLDPQVRVRRSLPAHLSQSNPDFPYRSHWK